MKYPPEVSCQTSGGISFFTMAALVSTIGAAMCLHDPATGIFLYTDCEVVGIFPRRKFFFKLA